MSYGVAVNTQIAGSAVGDFKDDLTTVGKWPRPNEIRRISKIEIWKGNVIDSVRITYETSSGTIGPIIHGGDGGDPATDFKLDLDPNQTITAVYGRRLNDTPPPPEDYGKHCIVQLSFVVATMEPDNKVPSVRVHSVDTGFLKRPNTQFKFTWPLVGATSYTSKPKPADKIPGYLQGLGFTELFAQAGGPL